MLPLICWNKFVGFSPRVNCFHYLWPWSWFLHKICLENLTELMLMLHMLRFPLLLSLVELWRLYWLGEVLVENAYNWGRSEDKRSMQSSQQIFSRGAAVHICSSSWNIRQGFNSVHLIASKSRKCNLWRSYHKHKCLQPEELSEQLLLVMKAFLVRFTEVLSCSSTQVSAFQKADSGSDNRNRSWAENKFWCLKAYFALQQSKVYLLLCELKLDWSFSFLEKPHFPSQTLKMSENVIMGLATSTIKNVIKISIFLWNNIFWQKLYGQNFSEQSHSLLFQPVYFVF